MLELLAVLCVIAAIGFLIILSLIDLKERILPNEFVLAFAVCGFVFHAATLFAYSSFVLMALGALFGGGMLFSIRTVANYFYKEDTLGLGDVKLIAAAGLWLGPEHILIALTLGALAGLIHGTAVAWITMRNTKMKLQIHKIAVPAGPGFAVGIFIAGAIKYWGLPMFILRLWGV